MALDSVIFSSFACSARSVCVAGSRRSSNQRSDASMAYCVCVMPKPPRTPASVRCHSAVIFPSRNPGLSSASACLNGDASPTARPLEQPFGLLWQVAHDLVDDELSPDKGKGAAERDRGPYLERAVALDQLVRVEPPGKRE